MRLAPFCPVETQSTDLFGSCLGSGAGMKYLIFGLLTACILAVSGQTQAQSHAMIDRSRSSEMKNFFITQSVEGEFGTIAKKEKGGALGSPDTWRGYGIKNGFGIEVFRFTQFALSHTLLNLRSKESGLETLRGSRLAGEMNFAFSAPVTNIQFGFGLTASQMEYQNFEHSGLFVGIGQYYTAGFNYFLSPNFSLLILGKHFESHQSNAGGSSQLESIETSFDNLSVGLNIWI